MREIKAWKTSDDKVFFKKEEAAEHEEKLRVLTAIRTLSALLVGQLPVDRAETLAVYMVDNVRQFATAISPLITKSEPKPPTNLNM